METQKRRNSELIDTRPIVLTVKELRQRMLEQYRVGFDHGYQHGRDDNGQPPEYYNDVAFLLYQIYEQYDGTKDMDAIDAIRDKYGLGHVDWANRK